MQPPLGGSHDVAYGAEMLPRLINFRFEGEQFALGSRGETGVSSRCGKPRRHDGHASDE
jgi:hypothetical protein